MAFLYKFTCKPNYPIVTEAVLVVWLTYRPKHMIQELADIAYSRGMVHARGVSGSEYLGEIEVSECAEMYDQGILVCITGEY